MKPSSIFPEKALTVLGLRSGKPHDSYTRANRIFEGLSEAILAGYLEPQMKLPSEAAMALHFSVSRPVIRKALQKLRDVSLVDSMRGSGSYVCAPSLTAWLTSNSRAFIACSSRRFAVARAMAS